MGRPKISLTSRSSNGTRQESRRLVHGIPEGDSIVWKKMEMERSMTRGMRFCSREVAGADEESDQVSSWYSESRRQSQKTNVDLPEGWNFLIIRKNAKTAMQSDLEKKAREEPMRIPTRKRHNRPTLDPEVDPRGILGVLPKNLFHWFWEGIWSGSSNGRRLGYSRDIRSLLFPCWGLSSHHTRTAGIALVSTDKR